MKKDTQKKTSGESKIKLVKGYHGSISQWCLTYWEDKAQKQLWFDSKELAEEALKNLKI